MAEYWVGPSLRTTRPRWKENLPSTTDKKGRTALVRGAQPLAPRRLRAYMRLADIKFHDVSFLARYAAHIAVLVFTVAAGKLYATDFTAALKSLQPETPVVVEAVPVVMPFWPTTVRQEETAYLTWNALPETVIPERPAAARVDPLIYEVRQGDNPSIIAERFGLQPSTIVWSNADLSDNGLLQTGQKLVIPPVDGILYTVTSGDTLTAISSKYTADLNTVVAYTGNHISDPSAPLVVGQYVMVPGGTYPYEAPPQAIAVAAPAPGTGTSSNVRASTSTGSSTPIGATGCCRWPVTGRITTQPSNYHMALDIATALGTPIVAGDGGKVVAAGWDNTGYGYRIIIDHGNGIRTLYAHMSSFTVSYGDWVGKGDMIGRIGSTGRSTGPHLHFEVRVNGVRRNPYNWLP